MDTHLENLLPDLPRDERLLKALSVIDDPEIHVPITEMGLIYGAVLDKGVATITMTLTTIGCPLFDTIKNDIETELYNLDDVTTVVIDLTFDPPWHAGMLSEAAQIELGLL